MPRGDGTGPQGGGPMTGRGAGNCVGNTGQTQNSTAEGTGVMERIQGLFRGVGRQGSGTGRGTGTGRGSGSGRGSGRGQGGRGNR